MLSGFELYPRWVPLHFHTVIIVATFPVFIKYPVKGLRCHRNYQAGMGFTL